MSAPPPPPPPSGSTPGPSSAAGTPGGGPHLPPLADLVHQTAGPPSSPAPSLFPPYGSASTSSASFPSPALPPPPPRDASAFMMGSRERPPVLPPPPSVRAAQTGARAIPFPPPLNATSSSSSSSSSIPPPFTALFPRPASSQTSPPPPPSIFPPPSTGPESSSSSAMYYNKEAEREQERSRQRVREERDKEQKDKERSKKQQPQIEVLNRPAFPSHNSSSSSSNPTQQQPKQEGGVDLWGFKNNSAPLLGDRREPRPYGFTFLPTPGGSQVPGHAASTVPGAKIELPSIPVPPPSHPSGQQGSHGHRHTSSGSSNINLFPNNKPQSSSSQQPPLPPHSPTRTSNHIPGALSPRSRPSLDQEAVRKERSEADRKARVDAERNDRRERDSRTFQLHEPSGYALSPAEIRALTPEVYAQRVAYEQAQQAQHRQQMENQQWHRQQQQAQQAQQQQLHQQHQQANQQRHQQQAPVPSSSQPKAVKRKREPTVPTDPYSNDPHHHHQVHHHHHVPPSASSQQQRGDIEVIDLSNGPARSSYAQSGGSSSRKAPRTTVAPAAATYVPRMDFPPAMLSAPPDPQVRSPFLKELLAFKSTPSLGRFVYGGTEWILPSEVGEQGRILTTVSTETGKGGAGGRVEVFVAGAFLGSAWSIKGETEASGSSGGLGGGGDGWKVLLLRLNEERRVWGTEVYTDDSDMVAVLVHSGWVVPSSASLASMYGGGQEEDERMRRTRGGVKVTLRMVSRLMRYPSTERNGVRSRGWGNAHDGGSMVVEAVERVEPSEKPVSLSRRTKKSRLAQFAHMRKELVDEANDEVLNLNVFGNAGYKFSPSALYDVFDVNEFPPTPSDEEAARYGASPPTDGLRDFDLYLENPDECYRLHLLASSTPLDPQITVTILPVRPSPVALNSLSSSLSPPPSPEDAPDLLLGKVPVNPWDLEWVEGGLILREPGEDGEKGWFCRVTSYWWTKKMKEQQQPPVVEEAKVEQGEKSVVGLELGIEPEAVVQEGGGKEEGDAAAGPTDDASVPGPGAEVAVPPASVPSAGQEALAPAVEDVVMG